LRFWSPPSGEKQVTIGPGKLGIFCYQGWRPADTYARSAERDPAWNDDMLVAAVTFDKDPELAETALLRAQKAGYQGRLFRPLAARIAFCEFRFDDVLNFGWPLGPNGQQASDDSIRTYLTAATLSFKLEQFLQLGERYPQLVQNEESVRAMVKAYRAMPKSQLSNPAAELDHVTRKRITQYKAFMPDGTDASQWAAALLDRREALPLVVPTAHYSTSWLAPGFSNVSLTIHFRVHNTDTSETPYSRWLVFGLYDIGGLADSPHIAVLFSTAQPSQIAAFGMPPVPLISPDRGPAPWTQEHTLRIIVLHNRCEVTLDGKRVYYGPVLAEESKRRYAPFIQACGTTSHVFPPIFERLDDPRSPQPGNGK
jgi:hypothetical protein